MISVQRHFVSLEKSDEQRDNLIVRTAERESFDTLIRGVVRAIDALPVQRQLIRCRISSSSSAIGREQQRSASRSLHYLRYKGRIREHLTRLEYCHLLLIPTFARPLLFGTGGRMQECGGASMPFGNVVRQKSG